MKPFMFVLMVTCSLLAACGQPTRAPTTPKEEEPLFTNAAIDNAVIQVAKNVKELVGIDESVAAEGRELPALPDRLLSGQGELSAQAVLPNTSGFVFYRSYAVERVMEGLAR
jgi:hypothetical protein